MPGGAPQRGSDPGADDRMSGHGPVVVRELPGALARNVYAVARAASVRRPSVAVVLTALVAAAANLAAQADVRA